MAGKGGFAACAIFLWLDFVTNSRVGLTDASLGSGFVLGCFFSLGFRLALD